MAPSVSVTRTPITRPVSALSRLPPRSIAGAVGVAAANEPTPVGPIHTNIVGGSEATTPYPFMASLQTGRDFPLPEGGAFKKETHICGPR
jgi:hypothetical protein